MASDIESDEGVIAALVRFLNPFPGNLEVLIWIQSATVAISVLAIAVLLWICCRGRRWKELDVEPVPFMCLFIDSTWLDRLSVFAWLNRTLLRNRWKTEREMLLTGISEMCQSSTTQHVQHPVLVTSSVKTTLDLFFRVQKYPSESEVIVTAINAYDTIQVILHHGLHVVPLDIDKDTLSPNIEALRHVINENTVALFVSHLYGRLSDLTQIADIAHEHGVHLLEDCSQACTSPVDSANPESDLAFFSFDTIHPCTAHGGAITRVKDKYLLAKMKELHETYPVGSEVKYVENILKTSVVALTLNHPRFTKLTMLLLRPFKVDLKEKANAFLTAPPQAGLLRLLRDQPPTALLFMLHRRLKNFDPTDFDKSRETGDYVSERMPQVAGQIGMKALVRGYWLYPILVNDPDEVVRRLNLLGIEAARQVTQLTLITAPATQSSVSDSVEPPLMGVDSSQCPLTTATFIIDHVVYLPVHKRVARHHLEQVCLAVEIVVNKLAILKRYRARLKDAASSARGSHEVSNSGPYGPVASRKTKDSNRRRTVSFNPSVKMFAQVPASQTEGPKST
ncbi:uncharacterized protein [Diadema antillarum]|uniref:uncharacterized protein n=1 Tax=Diadema antillarum TaxID=105358 RepID=UPI003A837A4A